MCSGGSALYGFCKDKNFVWNFLVIQTRNKQDEGKVDESHDYGDYNVKQNDDLLLLEWAMDSDMLFRLLPGMGYRKSFQKQADLPYVMVSLCGDDDSSFQH